MSVVLFKDGETQHFQPEHLDGALATGWTLEPEEKPQQPADPEPELNIDLDKPAPLDFSPEPAAYQPATVEPEPEPENPTQGTPEAPQQPETKQAGEPLNNEQIRQRAKEAGIEEWNKARIRTLKYELGIE